MSGDRWEYRIQVWRARHVGWRWWVKATLNGRDDPTVPEGYPWTLTRNGAFKRAARRATERALEQGANVIEVPFEWREIS